MSDPVIERIDSLVARWKKFSAADGAERLSALEHAPTPELQRLVKEIDEERTDVEQVLKDLETRFGVLETGELGAEGTPSEDEARRHRALLALRQAYDEAGGEIEDRESAGEA